MWKRLSEYVSPVARWGRVLPGNQPWRRVPTNLLTSSPPRLRTLCTAGWISAAGRVPDPLIARSAGSFQEALEA